MLPIETPNPMFGLYLYPQAKDLMERQQDIGWFAQEIKVEKDIQDYKVNMSPEAFDLTSFILQSFVEIEQDVGDLWETIATWFPHSEIQGACSVISSMEKSVHAFFYQKMSDVLDINPEDTLRAQEEVTELKEKLLFIKNILKDASNNKPLTLATVAFIEQVLLFSNFGMLKSFQSNGNNLIVNTISGVDYVINDEVLHGEFAAYLFNTYVEEAKASGKELKGLAADIRLVVEAIIHHEDSVIDLKFPREDFYINGINNNQLKQFIRQRANHVLSTIGFPDMYSITDRQISTWFYKGANSIKMHDFFVKGTNSYSRTWSEDSFSRLAL